jgi:hypothetical protein
MGLYKRSMWHSIWVPYISLVNCLSTADHLCRRVKITVTPSGFRAPRAQVISRHLLRPQQIEYSKQLIIQSSKLFPGGRALRRQRHKVSGIQGVFHNIFYVGH